MKTTQRNYSIKDVDMLITASAIVESAITNKDFLISKRSNWQDPFFENLKTRIDLAVQNHLGADNAKEMRHATQILLEIQKKAIKDLAEVKVQITEDFKTDKILLAEILNQLGFTAFHKDAQKGDQEALINLLYRFKTNLTPALKDEITAKGTSSATLDTIIAHADALKNADVNQEIFKGNRKNLTLATITEFNEIYDQIISISKIGGKFFKDQPTVKEQFSFTKVAKTLNVKPKSSAETPAPPVE